MSKVATYLQGHILGELSTRANVLASHATDSGVLQAKPEMVVYPRSTNDIRKVARFAWQLAEKGHSLQISTRGQGADVTGAAVGRGICLDTTRHLNRIFEYESKQKLVRLQPGVAAATLHQSLALHGASIPALPKRGTVGGAVANDADSLTSAKYGTMHQWVDKLEVVLASGDVLQTERISKRELTKRKGIQGREGDIYRGVDTVLEDHADFIQSLASDNLIDRSGYAGIADVIGKNGSFDLTPLIVGSQGTLGIISEMILRSEYVHLEPARGVALFSNAETARDALDSLGKLGFSYLEYISQEFIENALAQGKQYEFLGEEVRSAQAMLLFGFDDYNDRTRSRQLKKAARLLTKLEASKVATSEDVDGERLAALENIAEFTMCPSDRLDIAAPQLIPGCFVPPEHLEEFTKGLKAIGTKLHVDLPFYGSVLRHIYTICPTLSLQKVSDKQKALKIIDLVGALLKKHGGALVARDGEGQLLSRTARAAWDDEYTEIVEKIRNVFDPHHILNGKTKTDIEPRDLVASLRSDNNL